ncbi:MAG: MBL fold metallo-hydrolase [Desulfurococcales archaeon]|nr:MBL fold metallo-hydrolase [Desulfurococcales archaeon]
MSETVLTIVNDNEPGQGLANDWGLSIHVSLPDGRRLLFDFDTKPEVLEYNMPRLGLDPAKVELGVLSHRHMDHAGGLSYIAKANPGITVYTTPDAAEVAREQGVSRVKVNDTGGVIGEGLALTRPLPAIGLLEHGLVINTDRGKPILLVGCSHPGVDRIASLASEIVGGRLHLVIGGFHKPSRSELDRLAGLAEYISPIHCSGEQAKDYVKRVFPGKYVGARTGSVLEVPLD